MQIAPCLCGAVGRIRPSNATWGIRRSAQFASKLDNLGRRQQRLLATEFDAPDAKTESKASNEPVAGSVTEAGAPVEAKKTDKGGSPLQKNVPYKTCSEAINAGLELYQDGKYAEALDLFSDSLELPGNGVVRVGGRCKEYSCPSEGEENAALYNMTCCYAKLGQMEGGLVCLEGLLENGFDDFEQITKDSDLDGLRGARFNEIVGKYDTIGSKVSKLLGNKKKADTNKPWLTW